MLKMNFQKINKWMGGIVGLIAFIVYLASIETKVSFWDSGEFIAAIDKLQVIHQPGAPLYLMIGKVFTLFGMGDAGQVALWSNIASALFSALTISFLFWTLTLIGQKLITINQEKGLHEPNNLLALSMSLIGSLTYAFTDSFWFSAVETEVYALSSLFTAVVFWSALKWEKNAHNRIADRWLVFIAFTLGLSIGVHLLNLLVIPSIALIFYFKRFKTHSLKGALYAIVIGGLVLGFIQFFIIQYLIKIAGNFDIFFVNSLGLPFGSGIVLFILVLLSIIIYGLYWAYEKKRYYLSLSVICFAFILFGYANYSMIVIRAHSDININISAPKDVISFANYVSREQYGKNPIIYGPQYTSQYLDKLVDGIKYRKGEDKYEKIGFHFKDQYDSQVLFPRMHSHSSHHVSFYTQWLNLNPNQTPTLLNNIDFFLSYQVGYMYFRYFMWNFAGRQNDIQGFGDSTSGNWVSGIDFFDTARLNLVAQQPSYISEDKSNNNYFFLPLIFGLLGIFFCFNHNRKYLLVLTTLFFFTSIGIIIYLNQTPIEPRERDYAYVGSFYVFCIFIGLGLLPLSNGLKKLLKNKNRVYYTLLIGFLCNPLLLFSENWDDHKRSDKYVAYDMAKNYLSACDKDAILFTFGDNDTYPLWYLQEVEGFRTDISIVNLSLLATDWYINQVKKEKEGKLVVPIQMPHNKYVEGKRDVLYYDVQSPLTQTFVELEDVYQFILSDNKENMLQLYQYKDFYDYENFLPTQKWNLKIDAKQVAQNLSLSIEEKENIVAIMSWTFPKDLLTKGDIAMMDILLHNEWKRPIYFASTVPSDNYFGLNKYLYNEGMVYRLLPLQPDSIAFDEEERVRKNKMYENLTTKFKFGNAKNAHFLDVESRRMTTILAAQFLVGATYYFKNNMEKETKDIVAHYLKNIPKVPASLGFQHVRETYLIDILFQLGMKQEGLKMMRYLYQKVDKDINYLYRLSQKRKQLNGFRNIQIGIAILEELVSIASKNELQSEAILMAKTYENLKEKFYAFANIEP